MFTLYKNNEASFFDIMIGLGYITRDVKSNILCFGFTKCGTIRKTKKLLKRIEKEKETLIATYE